MRIFAQILCATCCLLAISCAKHREVVYNSARDGSVAQVDKFLKHNWKDVGKKVLEYGTVQKNPDGTFSVPVKIRFSSKDKQWEEQKAFIFDASGKWIRTETIDKANGDK